MIPFNYVIFLIGESWLENRNGVVMRLSAAQAA
jgi:hypothetical protein